jgi:hypothetical protein
MQSFWLPAIRAQLALNGKHPAAALNALPTVSPIKLGQIWFAANISCLLRPAAALRRAQMEMQKQKRWGDPYYWAAFTIQGEWN